MTPKKQLTITCAAAHKVKNLIKEEGNTKLKLRVFISGGGSSGIKYGLTLDEDVNGGDVKIHKEGTNLLIDTISYQYLIGTEIDYIEGKFIINGPRNDEPPPVINQSFSHG